MDYGQQLPPEVIEAMLQLSGAGDEQDLLKEQLAMSKALMDRGMENGRAPSNPLGGLAHVAAKGMQGYMGGMQMKESMDALKGFGSRKVGNRRTYFENLFGGNRASYPRAMDQGQYGTDLDEMFGG